jgi:CBS domain-containing protein
VSDAIVHLSSVAGSPLLDSAGERLGRIDDVVARLDVADQLPSVVGLVAEIGGRRLFVPMSRVEALERAAARTSTTKLNLAQFERRPGEVLLRADVLDRSLINVQTARLVTARDVELVREADTWWVAGIDPSSRARAYRFLPRRFRGHDNEHNDFVPWREVEPFVGHVPTAALKLGTRRLGRLHPAQIADLVEAASHAEGEEILEAVASDKELEADVFEELDDEHQIEFLRERSDAQVAAVLARMEPDDVADLVLELDQERRLSVLELMPADRRRTVLGLLGHNPQTAGGIMNPEFVALPGSTTVAEALDRVRASALSLQQIATVCVVDENGALLDAVSLSELVRADGTRPLAELADPQMPTVTPDTDLPDVARLMTDYNLVAMPVLDDQRVPVGLIAVDDVLERLLPEQWRWRAGAARD